MFKVNREKTSHLPEIEPTREINLFKRQTFETILEELVVTILYTPVDLFAEVFHFSIVRFSKFGETVRELRVPIESETSDDRDR